jgi:F-type H+-transporting ATPase subunit gamma
MPSLKTVRKRINSVKSTQKITRAMKMVAGARLARAQQRITALRPYAVKMGEVLHHVVDLTLADKADKEATEAIAEVPLHPLLAVRPEKRVLFIVLSSDRGLCGAFNSNIVKAVEREWAAKKDLGCEVSFATIGRKAREQLVRRQATIAHDFVKLFDGLSMDKAREVSSWVVPKIREGKTRAAEFDSVYLIYNEFKSAISQRVVVEQLLPLTPSGEAGAGTKKDAADVKMVDYDYAPDRDHLLDKLVPMYVDTTIYRALLESQASEFGARMSAMDAATRNAKEMINKLTLAYNRARQAGITKELMEIVSGAESLKDA